MFDLIKNLFRKNEKIEVSKEEDTQIDKFKIFLSLVDTYLKREHPNIVFDCSIKDSFNSEDNLKIKKTLLIGEIIKQFADFKYEKTTQKSVKKELLWAEYEINSIPNLRQPIDFIRRKELAFYRDSGVCNRCGNNMEKVTSSFISFVHEIKDGGGYNIENIITLCSSCYFILEHKDKEFHEISLKLRDNLYDFV